MWATDRADSPDGALTLTPAAFAARWRGVTTTEKASAQSHFLDVCAMVGEPGPLEEEVAFRDA